MRIAMDDFGTGYSSLGYLSRLPVDILKMDRSFLAEHATPEASGLAAAIISLGRTLGLQVVAEGIESPDQYEALRELGCDFGQGFFIARPMDLAATRAWLGSGAPRARRGSRYGRAARRSVTAETSDAGAARPAGSAAGIGIAGGSPGSPGGRDPGARQRIAGRAAGRVARETRIVVMRRPHPHRSNSTRRRAVALRP